MIETGLITAACLVGGMAAGVIAGAAVHGLPMHLPERTMVTLASIPALLGTVGGGAIWGRILSARIPGSNHRAMTLFGGFGFGPAVIGTGILLTVGEQLLVQQGLGPQMPIHLLYTMLFVPATFLVAGIGSASLGVAVKGIPGGARIGFRCGLVAATAFLGIVLLMDSLGWRIGAPGAVQRATMVTVTAVGAIGAATAGGAMLGRELVSSHSREEESAAEGSTT
jgi:hypothetical protein